jgi:hypothetical protein
MTVATGDFMGGPPGRAVRGETLYIAALTLGAPLAEPKQRKLLRRVRLPRRYLARALPNRFATATALRQVPDPEARREAQQAVLTDPAP